MSLEEAREQLDAFAEKSQEIAENAQENSEPTQQRSEEEAKEAIANLDSLDKVQWKGRTWTRDELEKAFMMQSDYTKKTQALAKDREKYSQLEEKAKYADNLAYDLDAVSKNPALAQAFKETYPKEYHYLLEKLGIKDEQKPVTSDPLLMQRLERLENAQFQKEVELQEARLDQTFDKFSKKYDFGTEELTKLAHQVILTQAEFDSKKFELNDAYWEKSFKSAHDQLISGYKSYYDKQFKNQQSANQKGKDIASGGGVAGQAPVAPKSLKEAREAMISNFKGQKF